MKRKTVSTSKDLLHFYPFLEKQKGWTRFAEEFDKSECRDARRKAAHARKPPLHSGAVRELLDHCFSILHGEEFASFPCITDDGTEVYSSPEEVQIHRLNDAMLLAEKVKCILCNSVEGERLRGELQDEIRRFNFNPDSRAIYEACRAMFRFIKREERLPTKKELNCEVNRMKKCTVICHTKEPPQFGQLISRPESFLVGGRMIDGMSKYRVYQFEWRYGVDEEEIQWVECRLVPEKQWEQPYWVDTREVWKPGGFSGLSKSGKSQVGEG